MRFALDPVLPAGFNTGSMPHDLRLSRRLPPQRKRAAITASSAAALIGSCRSLMRNMVNRGHHVFAFAPQLSNSDLRILSHIGVEAYSLPPKAALLNKYRALRELSALFNAAEPDVLLVESAVHGALSVAAAKIARVPHIVTMVPSLGPAFMEGAGPELWARRQAAKRVYRAVFAWSDAIIFHSAHDRKFAQALLPPEKPQLTAGGWGEDLIRNAQQPLPPLDKGMLFLMAAPLDRLQGVIEFCEAAKAMRLRARRARFFFASTLGDAACRIRAAELKSYREFVQYVGPVADAGPLIRRCHVVVAPSQGNGAPRSLFQAMASGRPVITTDTRSCRDFVQEGLNGYLAAVRDGASLARAMTQILQRPDRIPLMAAESRRLASRFCDASAVNELVLETLGL